MSCLNEIGLSRKQRVFVVLESVCGTLQFPNATTDFVRPAGDARMNQTPAFVDSEEKRNTLDVLDRFQNVMPAAEWEIPMYIRTTYFGTPQGQGLLQSLQGVLSTGTGATINANMATSDTLIHVDCDAATSMPSRGVILVTNGAGATQSIYYGIFHEGTATGSFGELEWSYAGSTWATATANLSTVTLRTQFYKQETSAPSLSIWIETDHFVQGLSGATVDEMVLGVNNEGAVTGNFRGKGMEMVWAGTGTLAQVGVAANTTATVHNAKLFSVGAYITNTTTTTGTAAHQLTAVNTTTNQITFTEPIPVGGWAIGDEIKGYLPTGTTIGTPIESRLSDMEIDDVATKYKGGDITIGAPKEYITDEVGLDYPEDYLENVREITSSLSLYFRKENAEYFTDGYAGNYVEILLTFGSTDGCKMEILFPRVSLEVPTIDFAAPAVNLTIPMKAIGTDGEDSCEIYFH